MSFTPSALLSRLPQDTSIQRFWVALSGGLDSMVLLDALATLKLPIPLMALHINHQISPNAMLWQQHCARFCAQRQIPFFCEAVQVEPAGRGLEDAAREARYEVFTRYLVEGDCLLTAHHANDQAETILLRLMRGTGPRGLAAMARVRALGEGQLLRPLLDFTREQLEGYATAQGLDWINDESNADTHYDRNYLRHHIMPLLRHRWPDYPRRWQQTAQVCADSERLLEEVAAQDVAQGELRAERWGWSMSLAFLRQQSLVRRQNVLRYWLRQQRLTVPEQIHLQHIEDQLIRGREDSEAEVRWGNLILRRYRERLHLLPLRRDQQLHNPKQTLSIDLVGESFQASPASGVLLEFEYCASVPAKGYLRADLTDARICWRTGGERCQPQGRSHSQTLKRLLQEYGLQPWWREQLPLVYVGDNLAAVGDLWICEGFAAQPGEPGYRLRWYFS